MNVLSRPFVAAPLLIAGLAPEAGTLPQDAPPRQPAPSILRVATLPDGSLLVARGDGELERRDPADGEPLAPMCRRADVDFEPLRDLDVSPDGEWLAWIGNEGTVRAWPFEAGLDGTDAGTRAAREERGATFSAALDADVGRSFARIAWTASGDHLVTWRRPFFSARGSDWEGETAVPVRLWTRAGELVWEGPAAVDLDVHPTRDELALSTGRRVLRGWPSGADGSPHALAEIELEGSAETLSWSPDGTRLAMGGSRVRGDEREGTPPRPVRDPWVWVLDAGSGALLVDRRVRGVDPMEINDWTQCVRFDPSGAFLGVGIGKGHAVGVLDAADGGTVWSGGYRGGRMNEVFDVHWSRGGRLLSPWPKGLLGDPRQPDRRVELPWMTRGAPVALSGTDEVVLIAVHMQSTELVRLDPATGELSWERR